MHGLFGLCIAGACAFTAQAQGTRIPMPTSPATARPGLGVVAAAARARVVLHRDTVTGAGLVAVRVRVEGQGFVVAAYQGVIRFDAAAGVALQAFTVTGDEEQSLLNIDRSSPGVLKYAGFSARGFLTMRPDRLSRMAGSTCWIRRTGPQKLVSS